VVIPTRQRADNLGYSERAPQHGLRISRIACQQITKHFDFDREPSLKAFPSVVLGGICGHVLMRCCPLLFWTLTEPDK
jgi:hypothetical protein